MERDIVEILRDLTLDWDGSEMPNGAESRVPVYCLELREAAEEIERLRALLDAAQDNAKHWNQQAVQAREMAKAWEQEAREVKNA